MTTREQLAAWLLAAAATGCDSDHQPGAGIRPDARGGIDAGSVDALYTGGTPMELITDAPWKRTAFTSDPAYDWYGNGVADTDVLAIMKPCEADNLFSFFEQGFVFQTDEWLTKCKPADPQIVLTYWRFDNNWTELVFDNVDRYRILELTEETLTIESTFEEQGVTYTHVEMYGH